MEKLNLWTEEEVTLLKFYYTVKDSLSWREISNEMSEYTGVERSTTALMSKVNKIKDTFTKEDIEELYKDLVLGIKNTFYSKKFRKFIMDKFSKYYGDPNDIQEDYALLKMKEKTEAKIVDAMVDFEQYHSEDDYSDFKLSDYIYNITMWTIGIVVLCIVAYLVITYYA